MYIIRPVTIPMPTLEIDLDDLQVSPSLRDGVTGLWVAVFVDACEGAIRYHNKQAEAYLFEENYFFDIAAEQFSYTPEGLRERIRKSMARAREDHRERLALRGRCGVISS